jgi:glycopeptide antibiotics resistance protein
LDTVTSAQARLARRLDRVRVPLRIAYVGLLFLATLSWYRIDGDPDRIRRRFSRMLDLSIRPHDLIDGARNVLLFAGWGLLWMVTAAPGRSARALRNAVLSGAAISLLVEVLQLFSRSRQASVLDLATNTLGSALGAVGLIVIVRALSVGVGKKSFVGVPAAVFALSCGTAVAGEAFVPLFRHEREPWAYGGPFRRLVDAVANFRWGSVAEWPLGDFLLFLPAGIFAVAALSEAGVSYRKATVAVSLAAVVVLSLAELGHGAIGMQMLGGAVVVHVVAVAVGAILAGRVLPPFSRALRGSDRPLVLSMLYAPWILLWALRPYAPEGSMSAVVEKLTDQWWIPLRALAVTVDMFSVVDVIIGFCLFLPVGALLAVWPLRWTGPLRAFFPGLYLAAGAELAQTFVLTRTLDVTDFLLNAAGVAIGWTVVRRAGFRPYGPQLRAREGERARA